MPLAGHCSGSIADRGGFRDWLLSGQATPAALSVLASGITPEMAAAVSKLMRNQDLILAASRCEVVTRFKNTIDLRGHLSVRLQPNHPTDDAAGIVASMDDGLMYGAGAAESAPVDRVFQSVGDTQAGNESFGISLALIDKAHAMA